MLRLKFLVLLLFLSAGASLAWAQDGESSTEENLSSIINMKPDTKNDYALGWLQQIFGDFIFSPWGGPTETSGVDATIVSYAVGFSNVVALLLGIVIVGYVILSGIIRTAHEGEVLGKQYSKVWLPLRTAVAFGMITPSIGVGGGVVSTVQAFVLSLIIIGSNAGTFLWDKIGDQITDGTPLIAVDSSVGFSPSKKILLSLVCADHVYQYEEYRKTGRREVAYAYRSQSALSFSAPVIPRPIYGPISSASFDLHEGEERIKFGNMNRDCGSISFASEGEGSTQAQAARTYHQQAISQGYEAARVMISAHIEELSGIAQALTSSFRFSQNGLGGGENLSKALDDGRNLEVLSRLDKVVEQYGRAGHDFSTGFPAGIAEVTTGDPAIASQWKEDVTRGGWGAAGLWFFEISRFQMLSGNIINSVMGAISEPKPPSFCGFAGFIKSWFNQCKDLEERAQSDMVIGVQIIHDQAIQAMTASGMSAQERTQAELESADAENVSSGFLGLISANMAQSILNAAARSGASDTDGMSGEATTSAGSMASPFRTVTAIGNTMTKAAGLAWGVGAMASFSGEGVLRGLSQSTVALSWMGALAGLAWWVGATASAIAITLIPMGFILAYMIPFMPIITWTRLMASYYLTCIDAVVASPLAVILMATPEGEGISGTRLERAIQLLAAVVLRPTLLVIGLVASLTLAYVSFEILNFFFWRAAEMVTGGGLFELLAILVIYTSAAYQVAKMSIMVMSKLPDQVFDWMASGVGGRGFGDDAERGIEGGLEQTKSSMGSIAGGLQKSLGDRSRQSPVPKRDPEDNKKEGE